MCSGVSLALLQEQLQFPSGNTPRVSPDSIDEQHLGQGGSQKRWEVVADPSALEEDAAECLLSVAGTRTGVTALHMQACSSGRFGLAAVRVMGRSICFGLGLMVVHSWMRRALGIHKVASEPASHCVVQW